MNKHGESGAMPCGIKVRCGATRLGITAAAAGVPADAEDEPGRMILRCSATPTQRKHVLYALTMAAYVRVEDKEMDVIEVVEPLRLISEEGKTEIVRGLVVWLDPRGGTKLAAHAGVDVRRLINAAYRYCTRW